MGLTLTTPNDSEEEEEEEEEEEDNLFFPAEILEKILLNLSPRDLLIARRICHQWNDLIINPMTQKLALQDKVQLKIEGSLEGCQRIMETGGLVGGWTHYGLNMVEITRSSIGFWSMVGDWVTRLELVSCFISVTAGDGDDGQGLTMGCPNLRELTLKDCDKYLMMGGNYFRLHRLIHLKQLKRLDLSNNKYLRDRILFSLLLNIEALESLDLSSTPISFSHAVHLRFYPGDRIANVNNGIPEQNEAVENSFKEFSDNILSFQILYSRYLMTPRASKMQEFRIGATNLNREALKMISSPTSFRWISLGLAKCTEIKAHHIVELLDNQNGIIKKLELENTRFTQVLMDSLQKTKLKTMSLVGCSEVLDTRFLVDQDELEMLDVNKCEALEPRSSDFTNLHKLESLRLRGIIPFYAIFSEENAVVPQTFCEMFSMLRNLTELDLGLCGSAVTDQVLQTILKNLTRLKILRICKAIVSDLGLAGVELNEFDPRLSPRVIELRRSAILARQANTQERGWCLTRLRDLKVLSVAQCSNLSEASWKIALALPNLVSLDISYCSQISKPGFLAIMDNCRSLEQLSILGVGIHIIGDTEVNLKMRELDRLRNLVM